MEIAALLLFVAVAWFIFRARNAALDDSGNLTTIYLEQMSDVCQLQTGPVEATLLRQSGNEYRDLGIFDHPAEAIAEVEKSFRRAQIDSIRVQRNTASEFRAHRLFHSHRGRAEGKKLGGAVIRTLAE